MAYTHVNAFTIELTVRIVNQFFEYNITGTVTSPNWSTRPNSGGLEIIILVRDSDGPFNCIYAQCPPILQTKHKHTYKLPEICSFGQFIFEKIKLLPPDLIF